MAKVKIGSKRILKNRWGEKITIDMLSQKSVDAWNKNKPKSYEEFMKFGRKVKPKGNNKNMWDSFFD